LNKFWNFGVLKCDCQCSIIKNDNYHSYNLLTMN